MALPHPKAGEIVNLRPLGNGLKDVKTAAIVKRENFEAIRLVILAGKVIPAHEVSGEITLHCLEGHVVLNLERSTIELKAGDWLFLGGGEQHSLKAVTDSSLLLTIMFSN